MVDPHIIVRTLGANGSQSLPLNRLRAFLLVVTFASLVLLATGLLSAQESQGIGESTVHLVDGSSFKCRIQSIDEQGRVSGQGIPDGFNIAEVLSLKTKRVVSKSASQVTIYPVGGGEIFGSQLSVADEALRFQTTNGALQLPLQAIRAAVWSSSEGVKSAVGSPSKDNDQIVVAVADGERIVEGILELVDKEFVQVNYKNESRKIGLAKVKAFVVADLELKPLSGSAATVEVVDGSRFVGVISGLTDGELEMKVVGGAALRIKAQEIVQISIVSDRLAYLSDIEPVEVVEKSVFAIQLPWQRDRSVGNNPLRLNYGSPRQTAELRKGIGMQSFSQLLFANTNEFDRFKSVVGIDAETAGRGDCQMVVRGDGIELWSMRVKASDEPYQLDIDIAGIKQIALIVYPGEDFDLGDHVDWGEARFLKTR